MMKKRKKLIGSLRKLFARGYWSLGEAEDSKHDALIRRELAANVRVLLDEALIHISGDGKYIELTLDMNASYVVLSLPLEQAYHGFIGLLNDNGEANERAVAELDRLAALIRSERDRNLERPREAR